MQPDAARIWNIPTALRPVHLNNPNWAAELADRMPPAQEVGVGDEAEAVLADLLGPTSGATNPPAPPCARSSTATRSFRWAATLPFDETALQSYRSQLVKVSATDQATYTRDVLLWLWDLADRARAAGIDIVPTLVEVAEMSSDADRYGMGSTRKILLDLIERARV
ncbi:hypothetical protein [Lentzea sp. NEAU-D7]|uniref:hypothetical protein n=1 Tax=Lentzea sp. NEAU-D7 TaxID=2994667 RepID=UPI00224AD702|nr:hypothetical protein [Lentzea sp. NEAU-D7]MCX2952822.1 hypothetical protein [Lentzea sp. NEAU-D7]